MPLVALGFGEVLDATLDDLGAGRAWESIYKVKPRADLHCKACSARVHAKLSRGGLRFFAHDAAQSTCPLNGESLAHRILKAAIAAALREAGWVAELEAAAPDGSWRADVLGTSGDGTRRVAWEVQLAGQTDAETWDRTRRYEGSGIETVWVADRSRPWSVPALVVETRDRTIVVKRGAAQFPEECCTPRARCQHISGAKSVPCPGHGRWRYAEVQLERVVAGVCSGQVFTAELPADISVDSDSFGDWRLTAATQVWTTGPHLDRFKVQHAAWTELEERDRLNREAHLANIQALEDRQGRLTPYVMAIIRNELRESVSAGDVDLDYGMGVPIYTTRDRRLQTVICPVASRINRYVRDVLADVVVVVGSNAEADRIAARCVKGQRFTVIDPSRLRPPKPRKTDQAIRAAARRIAGA